MPSGLQRHTDASASAAVVVAAVVVHDAAAGGIDAEYVGEVAVDVPIVNLAWNVGCFDRVRHFRMILPRTTCRMVSDVVVVAVSMSDP